MTVTDKSVATADVGLDRDVFLRSLLRELAGTLEDVVGLEDASGYISVVGGAIGRQINQAYKKQINVQNLSREEIGQVLVDLKRRIEGDFYIIEEDETKIVLGNNACPFGKYVERLRHDCCRQSWLCQCGDRGSHCARRLWLPGRRQSGAA